MTEDTKDKIIYLIEERCKTVLETNALNDPSDPRYLWVKGVYDDILTMLKETYV